MSHRSCALAFRKLISELHQSNSRSGRKHPGTRTSLFKLRDFLFCKLDRSDQFFIGHIANYIRKLL